jgi:NitT/TauT family transport system permease protein
VGRTDFWLRFLSFVVFIAIWHGAAILLDISTLPSPLVVLDRIVKEALSLDLPYHLGWTLLRVAISFLVAMLIGTVCGIIMGRWRRLDVFFDSWLTIGLNIPALVTIILCYIWIGLVGFNGEIAAITAVALNKIPTVTVTVREGARAVEKDLLQVARAFRLSPTRTLPKVYLPQLYPYLMAAARSGLSLIWKIVLVVELLGRSNGIGFRLSELFSFFDISGILAYTVVFAAVVLLVEAFLMRPLERRLTAWRL